MTILDKFHSIEIRFETQYIIGVQYMVETASHVTQYTHVQTSCVVRVIAHALMEGSVVRSMPLQQTGWAMLKETNHWILCRPAFYHSIVLQDLQCTVCSRL